jgi:hypothetical protein
MSVHPMNTVNHAQLPISESPVDFCSGSLHKYSSCNACAEYLTCESLPFSANTSRASALALSTVLRTTSLYCGNTRLSGTRRMKTPRLIVMKFCTFDNVGKITQFAKTGYNRLARGGSLCR